jgi:hypothetical protein
MPPNNALPSAIATNPATAPIHSGKAGGKLSASNRPVIVADQSDTVLATSASRLNRRSLATHTSVTVTNDASADRPYCQTEKAAIGSSASTTWNMMRSTLLPLTTCGEVRSSMRGVMVTQA